MSREKIKDRIAKLLKKAEGTSNEHEAAAFMAKVNELMLEYEIEMHELRDQKDADPMGHQFGETNLYRAMTWSRDLVGIVAKFYGARVLYGRSKHKFIYTIYGRESARITCELMFPYIISQVKQQGRHMALATGLSVSACQREVGLALQVRINKMLQNAQERRDDLVSKALVPVDTTEAYMKAQQPNIKEGKSRTVYYSSLAAQHAEKVSLHHQAGNEKRKAIK